MKKENLAKTWFQDLMSNVKKKRLMIGWHDLGHINEPSKWQLDRRLDVVAQY